MFKTLSMFRQNSDYFYGREDVYICMYSLFTIHYTIFHFMKASLLTQYFKMFNLYVTKESQLQLKFCLKYKEISSIRFGNTQQLLKEGPRS